MKTKSNKLMTFRTFSIGFGVAVLALACGSDSNNSDDEVDDDPVPAVERETCEDNPLLAGCDLPETDINNNPIPAQPEPEPDTNADPEPASPEDLARAAAENVLASNCGQCHGPALTPEDASAGMNYINDIQKLADEGKIVPLNSGASRIIQRMREGSMPPVQSGLPQVTEADINIVAQFVDNPRFWPGVAPEEQECPDQLFDYDTLYREIAQDLQALDEDDRLTARYITVTNRFTAGVCGGTALDVDRSALSKLVNMLSTQATIRTPEPIDSDELIYRIDIEDYGWEDAVDVVDADGNVINFADKWEAIAANNQYAVPFVGQDADDAVADTGTAFPVMLADSMLDAASIGNVYYALVGVDVQQTLPDFIINELEIDVAQNLLDGDQVRAGTTKSRISRQDRVVQRDEIEVRQGALWQSFDFLADDQNDSIFENPFEFAAGGTEAIFTLPNGLLGFIIADENNLIVEDSDILLDTNQANFRAVTSISCSNCHAQGLIPVTDEVRDIALANARNSGLNADEVEQLREVYPTAAEFARVVEGDSQFYQNSLRNANVPVEGIDPVSSVFFRFDRDITLEDAAGDLGLTPEELEDNLNLLNPALGVLDDGVLDRDDFTQFFVDSLCILQVVGENNVDPDLCQAVADNGGIVP